MIIVGSDSPAFFTGAAVMRKYLPHIEFLPHCKMIIEDNRYYGLITPNCGTVNYDHVILDKMVCNPEIIFIVLTTLFEHGDIVNTFIETDNNPAWKFVQGVGFTNTGILRQHPQPLSIWSMTADEWQENNIRKHYIKQAEQQKPEHVSDLA